jgi:hypothetical protein
MPYFGGATLAPSRTSTKHPIEDFPAAAHIRSRARSPRRNHENKHRRSLHLFRSKLWL